MLGYFLMRSFMFMLLVAVVLLPGIGSSPLLDPDEPVYAQTALEMIGAGDYLSPRIYGDFWYDKPPFFYWLVALSIKIFGNTEWAARFPSVLAGMGTVLITYWSVLPTLGRKGATWSAVVLSTSAAFIYLGKACVTDMTLLLFFTWTLLSFYNENYWWMYICMGLGTLVKGPIALLLPGLIIVVYLFLSGEWRRLRKMHIPFGIVLYLLIAAPWYGAMYQAHGQEFISTFLGFHNVTRFLSPEHPSRVTIFYYIPVLLVGLFPWSGFLLQAIFKSITSSTGKSFTFMLFCCVWWVIVFLFFTACQTKLVSYILPLFPALGCIIGWYLSFNLANHRNSYGGKSYLDIILSFLLLLAMAYGWYYLREAMPEVGSMALIACAITVVLALWVLFNYTIYDGVASSYKYLAGISIITFLLMSILFLPPISARFSVRSVANYYLEHCDKDSPVYVDTFLRPGFAYYAKVPGTGVRFMSNETPLLAPRKAEQKEYFVLRARHLPLLKKVRPSEPKVLYRDHEMCLVELESVAEREFKVPPTAAPVVKPPNATKK